LLKQWFDGARCTYNMTLADIKENGLRSWMDLRNDFVTATRYYCETCKKYYRKKKCKVCGSDIIKQTNNTLNEELTKVPKHIRLASCKSVETSYKSAITNIKKGNINSFNVKFKSRKKLKTDSIEVEKECCSIDKNGFTVYSNKIPLVKEGKKMKKKTSKQIPEKLENNINIIYDYRSKEYFVCIPVKQEMPKYKQYEDPVVLSCDSGVKTFQYVYDSKTGNSIELNNRIEVLKKIKNKISQIQSKNKKVPYKHYKKFNNIITDTHWRMSEYLVKYENCALILLPHFESQEMKSKTWHKYNSILINMNKHYQFGEKLNWKCKKNGIKLLRVNESYTSKTCGLCGNINDGLTLSDRTFNCNRQTCSYKKVGRDYNGARNILIRTIS
jgi:putative transposase